jgi:hypothetical protein
MSSGRWTLVRCILGFRLAYILFIIHFCSDVWPVRFMLQHRPNVRLSSLFFSQELDVDCIVIRYKLQATHNFFVQRGLYHLA